MAVIIHGVLFCSISLVMCSNTAANMKCDVFPMNMSIRHFDFLYCIRKFAKPYNKLGMCICAFTAVKFDVC